MLVVGLAELTLDQWFYKTICFEQGGWDSSFVDWIFFTVAVFKPWISPTSRSTCFAHAHRLPPRWPPRAVGGPSPRMSCPVSNVGGIPRFGPSNGSSRLTKFAAHPGRYLLRSEVNRKFAFGWG